MSDSKAKDTKVFDVAKPGKSAPATTKPIIVTNRPVLQDPMVVADDDASTDVAGEAPQSAAKGLATASGHLKIEPITHDEAKDSAEAETPVVTDDGTSETPPQGSSIPDETADDSAADKPSAEDDDLAARKAAERAAELDKLAESRTYYLPINQVEKRRNRQYTVAGIILIIVLGLAWADIALDAGIITIPGVKAPTHLFK